MAYVSLAQMGGVSPSTPLYPKRLALDTFSSIDGQVTCVQYLQSTSLQTWPAADLALYHPIRVKEHCIAYKLWYASGSTGTDSIDIGIYRRSGAKIISTGLTAKPASTTCAIIDITDTVLKPDLYYVGFTCVSGTATFVQAGLVNACTQQATGMRLEQLTGPNATLPATATWTIAGSATTGGARSLRCGITVEVTPA